LKVSDLTESDLLHMLQLIGLLNAAKFELSAKQTAEAGKALEWFKGLAMHCQKVWDDQSPKLKAGEKKEGDAPPSAESPAAADPGPLKIKNYNPGKPPTAKQLRGK
jgi:hypothetical protein